MTIRDHRDFLPNAFMSLLSSTVSFDDVGFDIVNERGAPIVAFGYLDQRKATNARALIEKAIVDVALITAAGAHE